MREIILASGSPRRKELFEKIGLEFLISASNFDEDMSLEMPPAELAKYLAEGKAKEVAQRFPEAIVIGADTLVALDNKVLGKPKSKDDAHDMLRDLSGREHSVFTGFSIVSADKTITQGVETKVFFKDLDEKEIEEYIASGEPMDKAGSYAIQGLGGRMVEKVEGEILNVMGMPIDDMIAALAEFGVKIDMEGCGRELNAMRKQIFEKLN